MFLHKLIHVYCNCVWKCTVRNIWNPVALQMQLIWRYPLHIFNMFNEQYIYSNKVQICIVKPSLPSLMAPKLFLCPTLCWVRPSVMGVSEAVEAGVPWLLVDPWVLRELVEPDPPSERSPTLRFWSPCDSWVMLGGALWVFLCWVRGDNCWGRLSCDGMFDWAPVRGGTWTLLPIMLLAACCGT